MMDEEQALRMIEDELDAALSGISAPAHFAPAVLKRIRDRRPSGLPEILDFIGWAAVLVAAFVLLVWFVPPQLDSNWTSAAAAAVAAPALWYGMRSLRERAE